MQRIHEGAFHDADLFAFQSYRIRADLRVLLMLYQIIGFMSHGIIRISDQTGPFLLEGKPCQQIDLSIQQHLIQIGKRAIDIIIFPTGVFRYLTVIFIRIACFYSALLCSLLKDLIFIVADPNSLYVLCMDEGRRKQGAKQTEAGQQAHQSGFLN